MKPSEPLKPAHWTRRQFSQALAAASLLRWDARADTSRGFAYVGGENTLQTFQLSGARWHLIQTLAAAAPIHLEAHPAQPVLYAVHAVDLWDQLPRGAVSSFRIDASTGALHHLNTQPLSLAATHPRHAAVSPDGGHLLVAAMGGGIYNLLPLAADGRIEPPTAIRKELGLASPRQVLFHPDGKTALAVDAGQSTIGVFSVEQRGIHLRHRTHAPTPPSQIALSPHGRRVYALNDGSITLYRLDAAQLSAPLQTQPLSRPGPAVMAVHPHTDRFVTASACSLTVFAIDPGTGRLSPLHRIPPREPLRTLAFTPSGDHLLGIGKTSGLIIEFPLSDPLGTGRSVARVQGASCLLLRPATA